MPNLVTELTASCSVPNKVRSIARCLSWFGLAVDGILSWYIRPRVHEPWEFLTSPFYKILISHVLRCILQTHCKGKLKTTKKIYLMHQSHSVVFLPLYLHGMHHWNMLLTPLHPKQTYSCFYWTQRSIFENRSNLARWNSSGITTVES